MHRRKTHAPSLLVIPHSWGESVALGLREAADAMVGLCFCAPFIVVDLQLAIYCDAPGYKIRTCNSEELTDDKKTAFQAYSF